MVPLKNQAALRTPQFGKHHPASPAMPPIIDPHTLLAAYASGLFPMSDHRDARDVYWVEPEHRAILPLDGFHLSRSLTKIVRQDRFRVTCDTAFADVVAACAAAAPGRHDTWINPIIEHSYAALHAMGRAHSVECWVGNALVGGLYGVSLDRAFFGESMFSRRPNASKVALAWLIARLRVGGFTLLDCQFQTEHLASLGAVEMSQDAYVERLYRSVSRGGAAGAAAGGGVGDGGAAVGDWGALDSLLAGAADAGPPVAARGAAGVDPPPSTTGNSPGQLIVQLLTNTS